MITPPIREPWMDDALCTEVGGEVWFPEKGDHGEAARAKAICNRCDVTTQCLDYALRNHEKHGIFGGLSPDQRRRLNTRRRAA